MPGQGALPGGLAETVSPETEAAELRKILQLRYDIANKKHSKWSSTKILEDAVKASIVEASGPPVVPKPTNATPKLTAVNGMATSTTSNGVHATTNGAANGVAKEASKPSEPKPIPTGPSEMTRTPRSPDFREKRRILEDAVAKNFNDQPRMPLSGRNDFSGSPPRLEFQPLLRAAEGRFGGPILGRPPRMQRRPNLDVHTSVGSGSRRDNNVDSPVGNNARRDSYRPGQERQGQDRRPPLPPQQPRNKKSELRNRQQGNRNFTEPQPRKSSFSRDGRGPESDRGRELHRRDNGRPVTNAPHNPLTSRRTYSSDSTRGRQSRSRSPWHSRSPRHSRSRSPRRSRSRSPIIPEPAVVGVQDTPMTTSTDRRHSPRANAPPPSVAAAALPTAVTEPNVAMHNNPRRRPPTRTSLPTSRPLNADITSSPKPVKPEPVSRADSNETEMIPRAFPPGEGQLVRIATQAEPSEHPYPVSYERLVPPRGSGSSSSRSRIYSEIPREPRRIFQDGRYYVEEIAPPSSMRTPLSDPAYDDQFPQSRRRGVYSPGALDFPPTERRVYIERRSYSGRRSASPVLVEHEHPVRIRDYSERRPMLVFDEGSQNYKEYYYGYTPEIRSTRAVPYGRPVQVVYERPMSPPPLPRQRSVSTYERVGPERRPLYASSIGRGVEVMPPPERLGYGPELISPQPRRSASYAYSPPPPARRQESMEYLETRPILVREAPPPPSRRQYAEYPESRAPYGQSYEPPMTFSDDYSQGPRGHRYATYEGENTSSQQPSRAPSVRPYSPIAPAQHQNTVEPPPPAPVATVIPPEGQNVSYPPPPPNPSQRRVPSMAEEPLRATEYRYREPSLPPPAQEAHPVLPPSGPVEYRYREASPPPPTQEPRSAPPPARPTEYRYRDPSPPPPTQEPRIAVPPVRAPEYRYREPSPPPIVPEVRPVYKRAVKDNDPYEDPVRPPLSRSASYSRREPPIQYAAPAEYRRDMPPPPEAYVRERDEGYRAREYPPPLGGYRREYAAPPPEVYRRESQPLPEGYRREYPHPPPPEVYRREPSIVYRREAVPPPPPPPPETYYH